MMADRWIEVVGWETFQHYKDREPPWIKVYTRLLHSSQWLSLTLHQRGVLTGLWIMYAASGRQIPDSTATVSRQLGERVTRRTLDALNRAGFIDYSASRPLAPRKHDARPEVEVLRTSTESASSSPNGLPAASAPQKKPSPHTCPVCGIVTKGPLSLAEHLEHVHDIAATPTEVTR